MFVNFLRRAARTLPLGLAERRMLEMIADGAALIDILEELCRTIDAQQPDVISTVLLMDPDGKRLWPAAGPRVPVGWTKVITPLQIGLDAGSCGTAAFLKQTVIGGLPAEMRPSDRYDLYAARRSTDNFSSNA